MKYIIASSVDGMPARAPVCFRAPSVNDAVRVSSSMSARAWARHHDECSECRRWHWYSPADEGAVYRDLSLEIAQEEATSGRKTSPGDRVRRYREKLRARLRERLCLSGAVLFNAWWVAAVKANNNREDAEA